jgi:hypothetical protein
VGENGVSGVESERATQASANTRNGYCTPWHLAITYKIRCRHWLRRGTKAHWQVKVSLMQTLQSNDNEERNRGVDVGMAEKVNVNHQREPREGTKKTRLQRFIEDTGVRLCNLANIALEMPTEDAFAVLVEQERRRECIDGIASILPQLSPRQRRVLLMLSDGWSMVSIGKTMKLDDKTIASIRDSIGYSIKGNYESLREHLAPRRSELTVAVPQVKLCWLMDASEESANMELPMPSKKLVEKLRDNHRTIAERAKRLSCGSWSLKNNRVVWASRIRCEVPEYFQASFGDSETKCTMCSPQNCTRRKAQ